MNWVALALIAPFFWAASNFVDKYLIAKHTRGIFDYLFFCTIVSWALVIVAVPFTGIPKLSAYSLIPIATGIMLNYSYGFYGKALEKGETSALVILFKLIPVFTVILAFLFLHQTLSANELIGFFIVLLGAILVSLEKRMGSFIKGFGMIMIAIVIWAVMTVLVDWGLTKMPFWDYFLLDNFGTGIAGLTLFLVPRMRRQVVEGIRTATKRKYALFTGNNLLDLAGQLSIKKSIAIAPSVGVVTVLMQIQSFYAILIGILLTLFLPHLIKEDIGRATLFKKFTGAAIMFLGVSILLRS